MSTPVTIDKAAALYQGTGLTRTAIRSALLRGEIPYVTSGKKRIFTIEAVEKWLEGTRVPPAQQADFKGIRRIKE